MTRSDLLVLGVFYVLPGLQACAPSYLLGRRYGVRTGLLAGLAAGVCAAGVATLMDMGPLRSIGEGRWPDDHSIEIAIDLGWHLLALVWAPLGVLCGLVGGWALRRAQTKAAA